ncbi:MAG: hypothetical protein M1833_005130 [Piccolia ochrophora]|nr:MAG: hypothetical protein M1833_005130 [Piccolia ochrophora]
MGRRFEDLTQYDKPEKLDVLLKEDRPGDCFTCKVLGGGAFIALGGYTYFSGLHQLRQQQAAIVKSGSRFGIQARQTGITGLATVFVGMGLWRFLH